MFYGFVVIMKANENPGFLAPGSSKVRSGQVGSGQVRSGQVGSFWGRSRSIPGAAGSRGVPWGFRLGLPVARDGGRRSTYGPDLAAPSLTEYSRSAVGRQDFWEIFFFIFFFWFWVPEYASSRFCRKRHSFSAGPNFQKFRKWKERTAKRRKERMSTSCTSGLGS